MPSAVPAWSTVPPPMIVSPAAYTPAGVPNTPSALHASRTASPPAFFAHDKSIAEALAGFNGGDPLCAVVGRPLGFNDRVPVND